MRNHTPFNEVAHCHLMSLGYEHTRIEATWEDTGDAENGPHLDGGPTFDQYTAADHYVYIDENGCTGTEPRNAAMEADLEEFYRGCEHS